MIQPNTDGGMCGKEAKLPLRDWLLLLGLLTIFLMVIASQTIARRIFPEEPDSAQLCMVLNDPSTGVRGKPNTVCSQTVRENSTAIEYRFNSCGHRAGMEFGSKPPPGTYRIVMDGSSFAFGLEVQGEQTFAALLPKELSQQTGRKVQLYNEAMEWGYPHSVLLRFNDVLAAKPDMILWVLTPYDIEKGRVILPERPLALPEQGGFLARNLNRAKVALANNSLLGAIGALWGQAAESVWNRGRRSLLGSPSGFLLHHVLYASQSLYVKSYLMNDDEAGFLRAEPSPEWKVRLREFDSDDEEVERRAKEAGVPLVAVLVPDRAQAAMLSAGAWPPGYDPYKLGDELRAIVVSHGGTYIDILPDFRTVRGPERGYFPVDGHPDATGHAMIAGFLAKELSGVVVESGSVGQRQGE